MLHRVRIAHTHWGQSLTCLADDTLTMADDAIERRCVMAPRAPRQRSCAQCVARDLKVTMLSSEPQWTN